MTIHKFKTHAVANKIDEEKLENLPRTLALAGGSLGWNLGVFASALHQHCSTRPLSMGRRLGRSLFGAACYGAYGFFAGKVKQAEWQDRLLKEKQGACVEIPAKSKVKL